MYSCIHSYYVYAEATFSVPTNDATDEGAPPFMACVTLATEENVTLGFNLMIQLNTFDGTGKAQPRILSIPSNVQSSSHNGNGLSVTDR